MSEHTYRPGDEVIVGKGKRAERGIVKAPREGDNPGDWVMIDFPDRYSDPDYHGPRGGYVERKDIRPVSA